MSTTENEIDEIRRKLLRIEIAKLIDENRDELVRRTQVSFERILSELKKEESSSDAQVP